MTTADLTMRQGKPLRAGWYRREALITEIMTCAAERDEALTRAAAVAEVARELRGQLDEARAELHAARALVQQRDAALSRIRRAVA